MRHTAVSNPTKIDANINFWPSLIDMLTSVLMVFLLFNFLQTTLNVEDLEAEIIRLKQAEFIEIFRREFAREIQAGTVSIQQKLNLLQITFSDKILFQSGEYRLQPTGQHILRRCARVFNQSGPASYEQIQVEGHTDNLPIPRNTYPSTNWELSTGRAISVVQFLTGPARLNPKAFSANGYAFYRPVAPNTTQQGRARNRRIEIRIVFSTPKGKKQGGDRSS